MALTWTSISTGKIIASSIISEVNSNSDYIINNHCPSNYTSDKSSNKADNSSNNSNYDSDRQTGCTDNSDCSSNRSPNYVHNGYS